MKQRKNAASITKNRNCDNDKKDENNELVKRNTEKKVLSSKYVVSTFLKPKKCLKLIKSPMGLLYLFIPVWQCNLALKYLLPFLLA